MIHVERVFFIPNGNACNIIWVEGDDHCDVIDGHENKIRKNLYKDKIGGKLFVTYILENLAKEIK